MESVRKIKISLICILSVIAVVSCNKEGGHVVRGTVTEETTDLPYPNIGIYLREFENHPFDGSANVHEQVIDSFSTDAAGQYEFRFHKRIGYRYQVDYKVKNVSEKFLLEKTTEIERKKTTNDVRLYPTGYLKIHLQKTSSSSNSISYSTTGNNLHLIDLSKVPHPLDTILPPAKVLANVSLDNFKWQINITGGINEEHTESLFIKKGDTLTYLIKYN